MKNILLTGATGGIGQSICELLQNNYDIFESYHLDNRDEGILDDIQDLRRYLLLVEEHLIYKKGE